MEPPPAYEEVARALTPRRSGIFYIFQRLFRRGSFTRLISEKSGLSEKTEKRKTASELQQEVESLQSALQQAEAANAELKGDKAELQLKLQEEQKKLEVKSLDLAKFKVEDGAAKPVKGLPYVLALRAEWYFFAGPKSYISSLPKGCSPAKWYRTRRIAFGMMNCWCASHEHENGTKATWESGSGFSKNYPDIYNWLKEKNRSATTNISIGDDGSYFASRCKGKPIWKMSPEMEEQVNMEEKNERVKQVVFIEGGHWIVVWKDGTFQYKLWDQKTALKQVLDELSGVDGILSIAVDPLGARYILMTTSGKLKYNLPPSMSGKVEEWAKANPLC